MAKLTGDGGGAGGIPSTKPWVDLLLFEVEEVMTPREMFAEKVSKELAVVGGAARVDIVKGGCRNWYGRV
jgi:hypothetical protein